MAFYSNVWLFLLSGLIIGFGMSFTTGLCMSAVIDQWFRKKAGLAIGLAWTVNSVYMVVMSPVITAVIESVGWRNGYLVARCRLGPRSHTVYRVHHPVQARG